MDIQKITNMDFLTEDTVCALREYLDLSASKNLCNVFAKKNKALSLPNYRHRGENGEIILHRAVWCGIGPLHAQH